MNAGIDIGYNAVKGAAGKKKFGFSSVVGTPERSRFGLNGHSKTGIVLTDQSGQYLIGDLALHSSSFAPRREDPRWYTTDFYYRLLEASLGQATTGTSVKMTVVTGLPISHYDAGKAELKSIFQREHRFEIEGRPAQKIDVTDCRVVMQPVGTILHLAMDETGRVVNDDIAAHAYGVIDIGGKTTNMLTVYQFNEVRNETASFDKGGWDVMRAVRNFFSEQGYLDLLDLSDYQIMQAVIEGKIDYYDKEINLEKAITGQIMDHMVEDIIGKSTEIWGGGGRVKGVIITGGGAYLLGSRLLKCFPHARIAPDAQYANALGYAKYAAYLERIASSNGRK